MTTSQNSVGPTVPTPREPLRLRLAEAPQKGVNHLDGAWWPHSRDLAVELADLVDNFPPDRGRVVRVLFSPPDWDTTARRVPIARGFLKTGSFPRDDTHEVLLSMSDRRVLRLLVVPSALTPDQGEEALLAAATQGNAHSAASVLDTVTEHPDVDPRDHWA